MTLISKTTVSLILLGLWPAMGPDGPKDPALSLVRRALDQKGKTDLPGLERLLNGNAKEGLQVLDQVHPYLTTPRGRLRWRTLIRRRRTQMREAIGRPLTLEKHSQRLLWELGFDRDDQGRLIAFMEAKVFFNKETTFAWPRRARIEYLICQQPPDRGVASKSYESLAGSSRSELDFFAKIWKPKRALVLRWRESGKTHTRLLTELAPGNSIRATALGILLKKELNLNKIKGFPKDGTALQIGVVLPKAH